MAFKRKVGRAAKKKAAKGRIKKRAKVVRKRAASKKRAAAAKPKGARVELRPTRRKQSDGTIRQEWRWVAVASNGLTTNASEESYKNRKYALKKADAAYPTLPIYLMPKGALVPDEDRPSRTTTSDVTTSPTAPPSTDTGEPEDDGFTEHVEEFDEFEEEA